MTRRRKEEAEKAFLENGVHARRGAGPIGWPGLGPEAALGSQLGVLDRGLGVEEGAGWRAGRLLGPSPGYHVNATPNALLISTGHFLVAVKQPCAMVLSEHAGDDDVVA